SHMCTPFVIVTHARDFTSDRESETVQKPADGTLAARFHDRDLGSRHRPDGRLVTALPQDYCQQKGSNGRYAPESDFRPGGTQDFTTPAPVLPPINAPSRR